LRAPIPFFPTGSRRARAHLVVWGGILGGAVLMAWGIYLGLFYGLAPQDGGVLRPMSAPFLMGGSLVGLGILTMAGLIHCARVYVIRAALDPRFGKVEVETLAPRIPPIQIPPRCFAKAEYRPGRTQAANAPWIRLPAEGLRLPFVLDTQREFLDAETARRVLGEGPWAAASEDLPG
jgi:hypothetical protein